MLDHILQKRGPKRWPPQFFTGQAGCYCCASDPPPPAPAQSYYGVRTDCCPNIIPFTLTATVTGHTICAAPVGQSITLTIGTGPNCPTFLPYYWYGTKTISGHRYDFLFYCANNKQFNLKICCNTFCDDSNFKDCAAGTPRTSTVCSPLSVVFTGVLVGLPVNPADQCCPIQFGIFPRLSVVVTE